MRTPPTLTEADILAQVVAPDRPSLSPETAQFFLSLKFDERATRQIRRLLAKNNRGTITASERVKLERYLRVGHFLDLLQAKAKLSLQRPSTAH